MQIHLLILISVLVLRNFLNAADSDGRDFVFSFINNYDYTHNDALTTTAIVIPSYNDTICTFKYIQTSDNKVVSFQKTAFYGKTNEFSIDPKEVLLLTKLFYFKFTDLAVKDFRIFVSCTQEIKLIAKINDPVNAWSDIFLVNSITTAGNKYIFGMPTSFVAPKGYITILPIKTRGSITINIVGYVNGRFFSNKTIEYDTSVGQNQHYIGVVPTEDGNENSTIVITGSDKFCLNFATPWASTSNAVDLCGKSCFYDYIAFVVPPVITKKCNGSLIKSDQRIITNDFTTRVYISPPNSNCNEVFSMDVYNKNDNITGNNEVITNIGSSTISLVDESQIATSTFDGQTPMIRFGSTFLSKNDSLTSYGHFMHYIPSTLEWITGKSQFYTLARNCYLELYSDNSANIKIDGQHIISSNFTSMNYFSTTYSHLILPIKGYGIHSIETSANFASYVICRSINGLYDSAGYVVGFNQRK